MCSVIKTKLHKTLSTIRTRILLITVSLILLLSGIITLISYYLVSNNLRQNLLHTSETTLSFVSYSINSNIESVSNYVYSCQKSQKIQQFALEGETSDNRIKIAAHDLASTMYTANSSLRSYLVRMVIIGKYRSDIIHLVETSNSTRNISSDAVLALPYFDSLHDAPGNSSAGIMQDPFYTARPIPMIPFVDSIQHPYKLDEVGYIFTEMSVDAITEPIHNLSKGGSQFYVKIEDNLYQYAENTLIPCEEHMSITETLSYQMLNEQTTVQKIYRPKDNETTLAITQPLRIDGWSVMMSINERELSQQILNTFLLILLIIVAVASFIGITLFGFLSRTINVPVKQLQLRMKRIEMGDFSRDSSTEWEHELGDVGKTINDLSENLLFLMNQRIEDEKQKKDYEYRMLQSQINPHFMHNTLNSIKWMATIQNAPGIAEMTTALSRLLKNISNGTATLIPISQELNLIQDYFTIQKYRYGGTITMSVQIDNDALLSCLILKFTLQPLIENAIFHGIEPKGTSGSIHIHIFEDTENHIHIDVHDDGIGIEPQVAATLLDQDTPNTGSSFFKEIGIGNVHKRLQYEFGTQYGLSITSSTGQGTTVTILLPSKRKEENYD